MKHLFFSFVFLFFLFYFAGCVNKSNNSNSHLLSLSAKADSLIQNKVPVNPIVDSLKKAYANATSDTSQIDALNILAEEYRSATPVLAEEALSQSQKRNYKYGIADAICLKGMSFFRRSEYDSAAVYYAKSLELGQKIAGPQGEKIISKALYAQGTIYYMQSANVKALDYIMRSLAIAEKINDNRRTAICLSMIGSTYKLQDEYPKALEYLNRALEIAEKIGDKMRMSYCLTNIGEIYMSTADNVEALEYFRRSLKIAELIKDNDKIQYCLNMTAEVYYLQADYVKALEYYNRSMKLAEESGDKADLATVYSSIGDIFATKKEFVRALDYFTRALKLEGESENKSGYAFLLNSIGNIYHMQNDNAKALDYYHNALKLAEEIGDRGLIMASLIQTGSSYSDLGDNVKALEYYRQTINIADSLDDKRHSASAWIGIANVYLKMNDIAKARTASEKSLSVAKESGANGYILEAAEVFYKASEKSGDYKKAFEAHKLFMEMNDSITNADNIKKFAATEYQVKEERLKGEQSKKEEGFREEQLKKEEELKQQKLITYSSIGGGGLVFVLLIVAFRGYRSKKKANTIIETQKILVEEKNKDITDSINYAKKIQEAILPSKEIKYKLFPDAFVLFQPKDIVSGDFYWFTEKNGKKLISAVDCTGHGVPGAFMSMIGNAFLNEIVNEKGITSPAEILDRLREQIISSLKQTNAPGENKDGMDIALLSFDEKNNTLEFAGANNPLWLIRNNALREVKGDKQPIGFYGSDPAPFTNHKIQLQKGDAVYVFTDGFSDQFGGEKGKKFKGKQLQEILVSIQEMSMKEQEDRLLKKFNDWKGNLEQLDDVLVIGVRV